MRHSINPVSTILRNSSSPFISPLNPTGGTFIFVKKSNKGFSEVGLNFKSE